MTKNKIQVFRAPKQPAKEKPSSRTSTITKTMYSSILPYKKFDLNKAEEKFDRLGGKCIYCGKDAETWDHLKALIVDTKPSGYYSELNNSVPCCGKCNSSKGNRDIKEWLDGNTEYLNGTFGAKNERKNIIKRINKDIKKETVLDKPNQIEFDDYFENGKGLEYINTIKKINDLLINANDLADSIILDLDAKFPDHYDQKEIKKIIRKIEKSRKYDEK